jgi:hypothetical protein
MRENRRKTNRSQWLGGSHASAQRRASRQDSCGWSPVRARGGADKFQNAGALGAQEKGMQIRLERRGVVWSFRGYERGGHGSSANRLPLPAVAGRSLDRQVARHLYAIIICSGKELSNAVG